MKTNTRLADSRITRASIAANKTTEHPPQTLSSRSNDTVRRRFATSPGTKSKSRYRVTMIVAVSWLILGTLTLGSSIRRLPFCSTRMGLPKAALRNSTTARSFSTCINPSPGSPDQPCSSPSPLAAALPATGTFSIRSGRSRLNGRPSAAGISHRPRALNHFSNNHYSIGHAVPSYTASPMVRQFTRRKPPTFRPDVATFPRLETSNLNRFPLACR